MLVQLMIPTEKRLLNGSLKRFAYSVVGLITLQIIYGGFMSGLRAAKCCPTFPQINGQWIPENLFAMEPFLLNFVENLTTIQFIHRMIAYLLVFVILRFWWQARKFSPSSYFSIATNSLPIILGIQVTLGVLTLLNTKANIPVGLGVAHQAFGLLLISTMLFISFQFSDREDAIKLEAASKL